MANNNNVDNLATVSVFSILVFVFAGVVTEVVLPLLSNPEQLKNIIERIVSIHLITGGAAEMIGLS